METKILLVLLALSIGILTALTATVMPKVESTLAETDDCEHIDDSNCNMRTQNIEQHNDCSIPENWQGDDTGSNGGNSNDFTCTNTTLNVEINNKQSIVANGTIVTVQNCAENNIFSSITAGDEPLDCHNNP